MIRQFALVVWGGRHRNGVLRTTLVYGRWVESADKRHTHFEGVRVGRKRPHQVVWKRPRQFPASIVLQVFMAYPTHRELHAALHEFRNRLEMPDMELHAHV